MTLTRWENVWADAALGAIYPGADEAGLTGIRSMDVPGFLRELMPRMPLEAALGLRLAVWIVAFAPLFVLGRLSTIARLGQAERETVVARLVASEWYALRSLVLILKTFGALLYAGDQRVRARMIAPPRRPSLIPLRPKNVHAA